MRIIAGEFKGRKFNPPANKWPTRPTTDFAKEGLYNILQNRINFEEVTLLDLFGGTGNHCYEFISRGCIQVTYVDKYKPCINFVKQTAAILKIESKIDIHQSDVFKFLDFTPFRYDVIFADPPYDLKTMLELPDKILKANILNVDGILIIEHSNKTNFEFHTSFVESRAYGGCMFSFFKKVESI